MVLRERMKKLRQFLCPLHADEKQLYSVILSHPANHLHQCSG